MGWRVTNMLQIISLRNIATPKHTHIKTMKQLDLSKNKSNAKLYSSGFTLLEILVAIIILSFGLLGMVGIQAMALKSNNDAKQQSAAVQLAAELSDMMRGNKAIAVATTPATNPYLITDFQQASSTIVDPVEKCNLPAGCTTPFNIASWESFDWLSRVNATFPGVHVQVCYDTEPYTPAGLPKWGCAGAAALGGKISIKIGWIRASTNSDRSTSAAQAAALTDVSGPNPTSPPSVIYIVTPGT
jgi:type IV pilus assembly protein PilV